MPYRKREANRIDEENQKMIERIMNANSSIPLKKLEKEFQNHLQLKKIIQKSQPIPVEKLLQKKQKQFENLESQLFPAIESSNSPDKEATKIMKKRSNSERKS